MRSTRECTIFWSAFYFTGGANKKTHFNSHVLASLAPTTAMVSLKLKRKATASEQAHLRPSLHTMHTERLAASTHNPYQGGIYISKIIEKPTILFCST